MYTKIISTVCKRVSHVVISYASELRKGCVFKVVQETLVPHKHQRGPVHLPEALEHERGYLPKVLYAVTLNQIYLLLPVATCSMLMLTDLKWA